MSTINFVLSTCQYVWLNCCCLLNMKTLTGEEIDWGGERWRNLYSYSVPWLPPWTGGGITSHRYQMARCCAVVGFPDTSTISWHLKCRMPATTADWFPLYVSSRAPSPWPPPCGMMALVFHVSSRKAIPQPKHVWRLFQALCITGSDPSETPLPSEVIATKKPIWRDTSLGGGQSKGRGRFPSWLNFVFFVKWPCFFLFAWILKWDIKMSIGEL